MININAIKWKPSMCQVLSQCRWAKKANEKRKKDESSENVSERKTAGREKVSLSLPSSQAVFRTFFDQFSALSWNLEHANENRSLGKQTTFFWVAAWQIQHFRVGRPKGPTDTPNMLDVLQYPRGSQSFPERIRLTWESRQILNEFAGMQFT